MRTKNLNGILILLICALLASILWLTVLSPGNKDLEDTTSEEVEEALICIKCNNVTSMKECAANTIMCNIHEKCYLETMLHPGGKTTYNAGCRSNEVCLYMTERIHMGQHDENDPPVCGKCCDAPPVENELPCNVKLCEQNL